MALEKGKQAVFAGRRFEWRQAREPSFFDGLAAEHWFAPMTKHNTDILIFPPTDGIPTWLLCSYSGSGERIPVDDEQSVNALLEDKITNEFW